MGGGDVRCVDGEEEVDGSCAMGFSVCFVESAISNLGTRPDIEFETLLYIIFLSY